MPKVTLDMNTFKALASDTRLDILRALDGKKMSLNDISKATRLNKATLHEHLQKLNEAGLVKRKEREGHKWVYYKLTWKGEGLLHPENTKIVIMFSITFISLFLAVMLLVSFAQPIAVGMARNFEDTTLLYEAENDGIPLFSKSVNYRFVGEINGENQTLENITSKLQSSVKPKNAIGQTLATSDIRWDIANICLEPEEYKYNYASAPPDNSTTTFNETKGDNNITYNDTYGSKMVNGGRDSFESYPSVIEMIATVQDTSLLYLAIVCLAVFGMLFITSSWKLWKNRTPKL